jgi:hypothetical protein
MAIYNGRVSVQGDAFGHALADTDESLSYLSSADSLCGKVDDWEECAFDEKPYCPDCARLAKEERWIM